MQCKVCGGMDLRLENKTFRDGTHHTKISCANCDTFWGWKKRTELSFKERLFRLVQKLADSDIRDFETLRVEAINLMSELP